MRHTILAAVLALSVGGCAAWPEASAPGYRMAVAEAPVRAGLEGRNPPALLAQEQGGGWYLVHASLPMAGSWQAVLTAQVPGEALPVRERVSVRVMP